MVATVNDLTVCNKRASMILEGIAIDRIRGVSGVIAFPAADCPSSNSAELSLLP
jgi:hypothetical protein